MPIVESRHQLKFYSNFRYIFVYIHKLMLSSKYLFDLYLHSYLPFKRNLFH